MNFVKVIYFDEESALDYLDLNAGGRFYFNEENVKELSKGFGTESEAEVKAGTSIPFLNFLFSARAKGSVSGSVSKQGDRIIQSTLSNTVLTDFVNQIRKYAQSEEDKSIKKLKNTKAIIYKDSYAYYKVLTPFISLVENKTFEVEEMDIDLGKMDEMLKSAKGYYELLGVQGDNEFVLRFNSNWFRNNYRIFDLEKMDLTYLGVKVGTCTREELRLESQLPSDSINDIKKENNDLVSEFLESNEDLKFITQQTITEEETNENDELDIYDVLLAGVSNE